MKNAQINIITILMICSINLFGQKIIPDYKWKLDAKSAFIHASRDDVVVEPLIIDLQEVGLRGGDSIKLIVTGDFSFDKVTRKEQKSSSVLGVFSKTNYLLSKNEINRVPDAIDCGKDKESGKTFFGKVSTDIPEDFQISNTSITIPEEAKYLFVGVNDSYYKDNGNSNNFMLILTRLSTQLNKTEVKYIDEINVKNEKIQLVVWDNKEEDGDIITLYLNNQIVAEKLEVKKKKKKLKIVLRKGTNSLVMYAENLGRVGKNTAAISINDKSNKREIIFNSDTGVSEGLIIKR